MYKFSYDRWFHLSANAYGPFVIVYLVCCTLYMAITLFYFDLVLTICYLDYRTLNWIDKTIYILQKLKDPDIVMVLLVMTTFVALSVLFLYCYFGKLAADSYELMCECVYDSFWQKLSPNLQKYIVVMIANMQQSLYYHGFGIVTLDLRTFIRVRYSRKN